MGEWEESPCQSQSHLQEKEVAKDLFHQELLEEVWQETIKVVLLQQLEEEVTMVFEVNHQYQEIVEKGKYQAEEMDL